MSTLSIKLQAEELKTLAFGDITDTYSVVETLYQNPVRIYHLQNLTNVNLVWSWDGITDNGVIAAGGFILLDITANKSLPEGQYLPRNGATYIRSFTGSNPISGSVYLTLLFGATN